MKKVLFLLLLVPVLLQGQEKLDSINRVFNFRGDTTLWIPLRFDCDSIGYPVDTVPMILLCADTSRHPTTIELVTLTNDKNEIVQFEDDWCCGMSGKIMDAAKILGTSWRYLKREDVYRYDNKVWWTGGFGVYQCGQIIGYLDSQKKPMKFFVWESVKTNRK